MRAKALSSLSNPAIQECEVLHLQRGSLSYLKLGTYQWSEATKQRSPVGAQLLLWCCWDSFEWSLE